MSKPNIITFILDDTDFDMMTWSGGQRVLSPAIDGIARDGMARSPFLADKLAEMKQRLAAVCDTFERPFPVERDEPFLWSQAYRQLCHNADDAFDPTEWEWYAKGWY